MSNYTTTPKGTKLPLLKLKNKDYLMGAYRLVWLNEEYTNFSITTDFIVLTDEQTVAKSTVILYDNEGKPIKSATATKRETKRDFPDHTEKAESSSIFRALAMLGMGTQHCVVEFDEGERIVDSPVETKQVSPSKSEEPVKKSSFRKEPKKEESKVEVEGGDGWE